LTDITNLNKFIIAFALFIQIQNPIIIKITSSASLTVRTVNASSQRIIAKFTLFLSRKVVTIETLIT